MLSYIHAFHAGNKADIFKHTCLTAILSSLIQKEKPLTVIDTHAGSGIYRIDDERLVKTGEAKEGIEKLYGTFKSSSVPFTKELTDYLKLESTWMEEGLYAGSPEIEREMLRSQDKLFLIEKHPQALQELSDSIQKSESLCPKDRKDFPMTKILEQDSYTSLKALVPPQIKRGLIMMDPSFEDSSDYTQVTQSLKEAHKKWNTAVIALWYPLITRRKNETAQMLTALQDDAKLSLNPSETLTIEYRFKDPEDFMADDKAHLYGSGMFILNPPWQLKEKMESAIRFLEKIDTVEWI